MGAEVAVGATIVGAVAGGLAKDRQAGAQQESADLQMAALDLQKQQFTIVQQQKLLGAYDMVKKITDENAAKMTVRGVSFDSPSYEAIAANTFKTLSREVQNENLEQAFVDRNIQLQKQNIKSKLYTDLFGDVESFASNILNVAKNFPVKV